VSDAPDTIDQAEAECQRALEEYQEDTVFLKSDVLSLMRFAFHRGAGWVNDRGTVLAIAPPPVP
jgi:hypothetical protein